MNTTDQPAQAQGGASSADRVRAAVKKGTNAVEQGVEAAGGDAAGKLERSRDQIAQSFGEASGETSHLVQSGKDALADVAKGLREQASVASDAAVAYAKDEPMKVLLISAAAGALLVGLLSMMGRRP